ncbi:MAG TPA: DNA polymerase III subunit gamma/tau [Candidatus Saccharimonadia bacterium]
MGELALYRKYRSASFSTVIGQSHVIETLQQAISSDRLSHAYLFTGPRGVGKTSVARLLARAANCTSEDPGKRPCGTCSNCKIEIGSHLDLIEIDAASNRGIDDARALREKISSAPAMGRYKVYIIDEVHMLTTEAFNALLKTLEEPPAHAIFILATTEAHKLPVTIISRTQQFRFKLITQDDLLQHLGAIAKQEGITIEAEALELLATTSRGGFRDAISLLDQIASSGTSPLTVAVTRQLLGHSDPELLEAIDAALMVQDTVAALQAVDQAIAQGVQAGQLTNQLVMFERHKLQALVHDGAPDSELQRTAQVIQELLPVLKSSWPEISLEVALVALTTPDTASSHPVAAKVRPGTAVSAKPAVPSDTPTAVAALQAEPLDSVPDPDLWVKALTQIKQRNNSLYALLRSCSLEFDNDRVTIGCKFSFFRDRLKEPKNLEIIEQTLSRVYGRKLRVMPQLEAATATVPATADSSAELMSSALEILGGEVIHE